MTSLDACGWLLHNTSNGSNKYYAVIIVFGAPGDVDRLITCWGAIGANPQVKTLELSAGNDHSQVIGKAAEITDAKVARKYYAQSDCIYFSVDDVQRGRFVAEIFHTFMRAVNTGGSYRNGASAR